MTREKRRVLLVDDEEKVLVSLSRLLEDKGFQVLTAASGEKALPLVEEKDIEAVLLDLVMPSGSGLDLLKDILARKPDLPVIMLTGHGTIAKAVEATKLGAFDFLEKPVESGKILIALENALRKYHLEQERSLLIQDALDRYRMVGVSKSLHQIFELIEKVAASDTRVLITGENGTGKELVARAIHLRSHRAGGPFQVVNCAAIPEDLIESELFGHERGAFTGAVQRRLGKFEQASGGTLFLDEVGDMSAKIQAKVLRAIEEGDIQRVGGQESIRTDARIIAASNKDLKEAVRTKAFREDLFFRLNIINIHVPPLRERREDIPVIADYFLRVLCEERKREPMTIPPAAIEALVQYDWPGNVRELRNFIEKAVVLSAADAISQDEVEEYLRESYLEGDPKNAMNGRVLTLAERRNQIEKTAILSKLMKTKWNYVAAAEELGVSRATLFNKLKKLGLSRKSLRK